MRATPPTYTLDHDDIVKLTCAGLVPIDAAAELLALDAHIALAMKHGQVFGAQKLIGLHNELFDLMSCRPRCADLLPFRRRSAQ